VMAGPMIQLLAAETLIQGSAPVDHGFAVPLMLTFALVLVMANGGEKRRAVLFVVGASGLLLLPLATEWGKLGSFSIAPALLALLGGTLTMIIHSALQSASEARLFDIETGLPNGRSFQDLVTGRTGGSAIVARIANFGDVASVLGRAQAAELMSRIAQRLAFAADTPIHRIDDGALAWLSLTGDPDEEVERLDAAALLLRAPFELGGRQLPIAFGFGMAAAGDRDAPTRAAKAADIAIARALRWSRYTMDLEKDSEWRLGLAAELDQAMIAGDIWVAYQPKLNIRTRRVTATEALVRWRHPVRGVIPPDAFIPALEESGRIADLTLWVLDRALTDRAGWSAAGLDLNVAVNLSALLPADPVFVQRLETVLRDHAQGVPALTLEVTESAAMTDPDSAIAALNRLAAMGLALSIDDYGTGLSTLSYLKRLPAREIKIDKSFVMALESNHSDRAMVRSTIDLAHELGFKVVAEGVETEACLQILASFGCDMAQGWHIGKPVPQSELRELAEFRFSKAG